MQEDERRLSFPPPAPLHSPGEEIDGSRLLGEIVRTLEATNPEAAAPLVASQSKDALDTECEKPRREELRIPLDVTFSEPPPGRSDEPRAVVTPFTRESAKRAGSRGAQLVREFGFMPRRRLSVEDGARLPRKYEPFPPKLYGRPLEEIDNFIYDETFCVVSKRFRKNYIHRFTATRSLFWWSPWSPVRRACVYLSTNQYFDYFVMATILLNCVFLAMSETIEEAEYIFLAIYTAEMIIKCIAKGFILNKYTYLRNPWNWLDFVVITSGYATIGMEVGNLAGLRTFRVLRALKTVSIMPGLKTIINALLHSFKQLAEVMTLTIFCLMVFALFALQVYMGELRNKCVKNLVIPAGENFTDELWAQWIKDPSHWMMNDEELPILCGNLTGARHCPPEYTCLCVGPNPNHGYTNFDNFLWSMLTTFQLITLDYWENVYNMVLSSCGPMSVSFFTVVVFFGSFYLINLMLAVVALSYEEESQITQEERKKDLNEHRDDSTFSFDPSSLAVRTLAKDKKKRIDARKGLLLASYSRKRTRRRKRGKTVHHAVTSTAADSNRWNFNDFFHSFMMIFRILCGEWIEPLWDCMRAEQASGAESCFFIFLPALVMGNFMVLNLFLALLLNSFNSEELKNRKEEVGEDSKLAKSFDRLRSIVRKKGFLISKSKETEKKSKLEELVNEFMLQHRAMKEKKASIPSEQRFSASIQETILFPHDNIYSHSYQEALNRPISVGSDFAYPHLYQISNNHGSQETLKDVRDLAAEHKITSIREDSKENLDDTTDQVTAQRLLNQMSSGYHTQPSDSRDDNEHYEMAQISCKTTPEKSKRVRDESGKFLRDAIKKPDEEDMKHPWQTLVSYVDELTVGGRKNSQGQYIDPMGKFPGFGKRKEPKVPQDCFPRHCYNACSCWDACIQTRLGQKWMFIRTYVLRYVDTPAFEWFVLVLIFASSITLCFEDIHLEKNKPLKKILYWTNLSFCMIFVIEMFFKWIALGFYRYFTSFWTLLDFTIVFVSVFSLLIEENENLKVLRSLRTLRALRPLRAISRWQGMRIVVNALMYAIPSIFNVLLVCLVFWLIFSIMGVQFFGGKFFKCVDEDGELLPLEIVNDKWECYYNNFSWINSKISFDHVGIAYLALFQVATFEGWMEVMADAVDARGVDLQPAREANLYAYIYFVIFIVCGSFFTLNLFIGVIIDNFNMLKKKYEGGVLEMFLTESQKHYYTAMKKLGRKKPQKVIKRPRNQFLAMFYDLSNSRRFEIAIFVLIFLNMLTMGIEHYDQPHSVFFVLEVSNAFFTTVFGLEAIVKIIGLRYHYFTVPWNVFDFLLVLASILGILMEDIMIDLPISPTLLRVVRVFRIGRILRLIKAAKGIRKLLFALVVSLPALFNIGALLALITFIYAIIGMSVFGHVKEQGALDDIVNFQTFGRSMQLLFRLMTSAGWNDVLESLMIQPPDCELGDHGHTNGNCGSPLLAITYFTSFIIISYMIVINMYIAIILENFNQAHQEEEIGIVEDDLEMFYIRWSKYDPHATQFISFAQLSDFIASLDPPLGISKPNTVALVSFNLPIAKGNKIHCLDILHALVKHVLGHVEETETFRQLQEQMDIKFKKQFPTRKELEIVSSTRIWKREDKAARTVQRAWREYQKRKNRSPSQEEESTKWSPGGGWGGRLSALLHVRRGSHASSRKSSRASDASDISEIGGAWLNLPLLLLPGAAPNEQASGSEGPPPRRRSAYGLPLFLRHQDAVDEDGGPKRAGSLRLASRRNSARRATTPARVNTPSPSPHANSAVSILVTEASPDAVPPPPAPPTVVKVLVHRESDEQPS
ncbi:sodium channel protein 60E-like [Zerene cesonia]|uniref:sodium channel protein 60E-like n=1 Tax=Zerene cesonia TaxID=33412 RepID=UPI0018E4E19A|nr:sodium channel protein 60E-like [Zerene cesonia]